MMDPRTPSVTQDRSNRKRRDSVTSFHSTTSQQTGCSTVSTTSTATTTTMSPRGLSTDMILNIDPRFQRKSSKPKLYANAINISRSNSMQSIPRSQSYSAVPYHNHQQVPQQQQVPPIHRQQQQQHPLHQSRHTGGATTGGGIFYFPNGEMFTPRANPKKNRHRPPKINHTQVAHQNQNQNQNQSYNQIPPIVQPQQQQQPPPQLRANSLVNPATSTQQMRNPTLQFQYQHDRQQYRRSNPANMILRNSYSLQNVQAARHNSTPNIPSLTTQPSLSNQPISTNVTTTPNTAAEQLHAKQSSSSSASSSSTTSSSATSISAGHNNSSNNNNNITSSITPHTHHQQASTASSSSTQLNSSASPTPSHNAGGEDTPASSISYEDNKTGPNSSAGFCEIEEEKEDLMKVDDEAKEVTLDKEPASTSDQTEAMIPKTEPTLSEPPVSISEVKASSNSIAPDNSPHNQNKLPKAQSTSAITPATVKNPSPQPPQPQPLSTMTRSTKSDTTVTKLKKKSSISSFFSKIFGGSNSDNNSKSTTSTKKKDKIKTIEVKSIAPIHQKQQQQQKKADAIFLDCSKLDDDFVIDFDKELNSCTSKNNDNHIAEDDEDDQMSFKANDEVDQLKSEQHKKAASGSESEMKQNDESVHESEQEEQEEDFNYLQMDEEFLLKMIEVGETTFPDLANEDLGMNRRKSVKLQKRNFKLSRNATISSQNSNSSMKTFKTSSTYMEDLDRMMTKYRGDDYGNDDENANDGNDLTPLEIVRNNTIKLPKRQFIAPKSAIRKSKDKNNHKKGVKFGYTLYLNNTHSPLDYDRFNKELKLKYQSLSINPMLIKEIKYEMNNFKETMQIHELSRQYTHFYR